MRAIRLRPVNVWVDGANIVECAICGRERLSTDVVRRVLQTRGGGTKHSYVCHEPDRCNDPYHPQNDRGGAKSTEELPQIRQRFGRTGPGA